MKHNITIVTSLIDLGRGDLEGGFARSFDKYLECFSKLLTVEFPMVIFCDAVVEEFVLKYRKRTNTHFVRHTVDSLRKFPFYDAVQKIRKDEAWLGQAGWLADSTQAKLELYNPLVMSKQFLLNDASLHNPFDTKYFLWMDAGLANTVGNIHEIINDPNFQRRITPKLNKMLYVCFPYDGKVEVHGFRKDKMDQFAGKETTYVARGGVFGGTKDVINTFNGMYYSLLDDTLGQGLMGTEESIFTILSYRHPKLCNIHMIEGNGLVYKFFEDLQNQPVPTTPVEEQLAIYALTFNIPKQFNMWVESFAKAYPKEFKSCKKYIINNSTDPNVAEEYNSIFTKHGFHEIKFDNIGINSARQYAAEHFAESGHEYMVFFEDDMLLCDKDFTPVRCKSGFSRWQDDLFDKSITIMENESLDYLKLCFSEFFGDNHDNWAWFNVPQDKKSTYFPSQEGRPVKKTIISHTGTCQGIPYAVGQYHYCNWPILFNKEGNKKVFLDTKWEHLYEQTLMSNAMRLIHAGKLRVGSLLATPIDHQRHFHYSKGIRRENIHYKN